MNEQKELNNKLFLWAIYAISIVIVMLGLAYASVPLYRLFCQTTGFGGTVQVDKTPQIPSDLLDKSEDLKGLENNVSSKVYTIQFNSDVSDDMPWTFRPIQNEIKVRAGETALAFYNAANLTDQPIIGISTYNVTPQKVGLYFNKIQCFCFEEQLLKPKEHIEMPVLFFIDPEIADDPRMIDIDQITLSYTFFKVDSE